MQLVIHLLKQMPSLNLNPEIASVAAILKIDMTSWDRLITTKFGRQKQNDMPRTKHRS